MRVVTVIKGDGIGPEVVNAVLEILTSIKCNLQFELADAGVSALDKTGSILPQETIDSIERNGVALKGPLTTPVGKGFTSVNVALRQRFDLYANLRPVVSLAGAGARYANVDIITVRENTEGMYSGVGQEISLDGSTATATSVVTRKGSERILRFAYELARREGRKKITVVHKANILKSTSGLFLAIAREMAANYPDLQTEEMIVDNACMQLVVNPHKFDVIVTTNLFGDILSDLCAGLVGGLGMAPGANLGENFAIFEAVHGSAPDIAGKNVANPTSILLAACQMLEYLAMPIKAQRIRQALQDVVKSQDRLTPDLGGTSGTTQFTQAIIEHLRYFHTAKNRIG